MRYRDVVAGGLCFFFALPFFYLSGEYAAQTALFPRAASALMMICGLGLAVRGVLRAPDGRPADRAELVAVGLVVVASLIYVVAVGTLGFVTASLIFIPLLAFQLGVRNVPLVLAATVIVVGLITYLFRGVFHIPLPAEAILTLLGRA